MKFTVMRILGLLMGIAWIVFGAFILLRHDVEGSGRVFGAIAIIVTDALSTYLIRAQ